MVEFFTSLFDTTGFPPRWHCGVWSAQLGWLHIVSDVAVFGAYTAIPVVLAYFVLRKPDVPFPRVFWLFVAFIFSCGFGHLLEAVIFWEPIYRFAGLVKLFTAIVSWGTVIALVVVVPQALSLPGLARLNAELRGEVDERRRMEDALRASEEKLADLLERERDARSEAEKANRIKDEFLSTVSHELRTPLHAILGYSQLLLHNKPEGEERDGLLVIERNARSQAHIIEDLLDTSRILSGRVRLETKTVNAAEIVQAAIDTVRPAAEAKGIRIQAILDPNAGPVLGDSGRLQQVMWNLLTNALKFTPKEGKVQVALERVNSHLEVRVSDNGQGIAEDFLPQIFDRFRQAEAGTTRRHGGLGLGLSIVKHLVELHGGTVEAQSVGEGQGSTFIVRLPIQIMHRERQDADGQPESEDGEEIASAGLNLAGVRVLVVDDEPDARELVRRLLSGFDAEVRMAGSADEALAMFRAEPPDMLLSDIGMPEKDGFDLMRAVRALPAEQGGKVPAAALTALARPQDRTRALLAGYQAHLAKPVGPAELIAMVATLTGRTGK